MFKKCLPVLIFWAVSPNFPLSAWILGLNVIKAVHDKPTANIMLNEKKQKPKLKHFHKTQAKNICPLYPHLPNIVLELLTRAVRKKWIVRFYVSELSKSEICGNLKKFWGLGISCSHSGSCAEYLFLSWSCYLGNLWDPQGGVSL